MQKYRYILHIMILYICILIKIFRPILLSIEYYYILTYDPIVIDPPPPPCWKLILKSVTLRVLLYRRSVTCTAICMIHIYIYIIHIYMILVVDQPVAHTETTTERQPKDLQEICELHIITVPPKKGICIFWITNDGYVRVFLYVVYLTEEVIETCTRRCNSPPHWRETMTLIYQ